jgi:hypothetical protein
VNDEMRRRYAVREFRKIIVRLVEDLEEDVIADLDDAATLTVGELIELAK